MSLVINWGKIDIKAKGNSTPSMVDRQPFTNPDLLKNEVENLSLTNHMTISELNQTILDGTYTILPINPDSSKIVLWSKSISDENCKLGNVPTLIVEFSDVVTSSGLTLNFWQFNNTYCKKVKITWYDSSNTVISSKIFYPDNYEYFCSNFVSQYKKLKIEFLETNEPYSFVKFSGIKYGETVTLNEKNIVSANLIEEVGLTSSQIFTNQLECNIIVLDEEFNIITNPTLYSGLQSNQQLNVENTSGNSYGQFFIQKSIVNGNIINLVGNDLIGYLENLEFKGGLYIDVTFQTILNEIVTQSGLSDLFDNQHNGFDVPTTILNKKMSGYIPYTNCREALHQLCYAASVVANCKRGEKIKIFNLSTVKIDNLDKTKLLLNDLSVEDNETYTGVSLNAFSYKYNSEQKELENKSYEVGEHTIKFTSPHTGYTITGATIVSSGFNYITFKVTTAGTIVIKGYGYDEVVQQFTANNPNYQGNVPSIKELTDVKMVSPLNAQEVANNQIKLYTYKFKLSSGIYNLKASIADNVDIENANGQLQKIEVDLLAEDVCTVEVLGNAKTNN